MLQRSSQWARLLPFACAVLLSFVACRKDHPDVPGVSIAPEPQHKFPISLVEAASWYTNHRAITSNLISGTAFLNLDPFWDQAFLGQSLSGREILVAPIDDSELRTLNQGRMGARLLFRKNGPDSISAQVLVYLADSAYNQIHQQGFSFNTFTGVYLFYDLALNFQYGINVKNGVPVGRVTSIVRQGTQGPVINRDDDSNNNDPTLDCITELTSALTPCPVAFTDCYYVEIITMENCSGSGASGDGSGDGGAGGDTGSGGGSSGGNTGNGGGTGEGSGNLGGGLLDTLYQIFSGRIPINIFDQQPNLLPEGYDKTLFQHLLDIHKVIHFEARQIDSLLLHPEYVTVIYDMLPGSTPITPGQEGFNPNNVKAALDFALVHRLSAAQLGYLITHPQELAVIKALTSEVALGNDKVKWLVDNPIATQGINAFVQNHIGLEDVNTAAQMLVDFAASYNVTNPLGSDFSDYGATAFPCGVCFTVAWGAEYALLKHDNPCPPGDWACDWELKARATWNVISTGVHFLLDAGGLVPVIGEIADLTNGAIYTLEGNYADAALSWTAAVPFIGWTALGAKYARKIVNIAGNLVELRYVVRDADGLILFGTDVLQGRKQLRTILKTQAGQEAHHIIPWELREHPVIQAAAHVGNDNAFHMNELLNGISLPTTTGGLPKHLGSHPNYSTRVETSLNKIMNELGPNITPNSALDKLTNLVGNIKYKISNTSGGTIDNVSGWIDP